MKATFRKASYGVLSCFTLLTLAGCGSTSTGADNAEDEIASATSELTAGVVYAYSYRNAGVGASNWYSGADLSIYVPQNPPNLTFDETITYNVSLATSAAAGAAKVYCQIGLQHMSWFMTCCHNSTCASPVWILPGDGIYANISAASCDGSGNCTWNMYMEDWTTGGLVSHNVSSTLGAMKYARPLEERVGITTCKQLPTTNPIDGWGYLYKGPSFTTDSGTRSTTTPAATPGCSRSVNVGTYPHTKIYQSHS